MSYSREIYANFSKTHQQNTSILSIHDLHSLLLKELEEFAQTFSKE
jgi:hypothetical protein